MKTRVPPASHALRVWPGMVALLSQWLLMVGLPLIWADAGAAALIGGLVAGLAVLIWWMAFSRAPWLDRIAALALIAGGTAATLPFVHPSIANGMMGMMPVMVAWPLMSTALVTTAAASRGISPAATRTMLVASIAGACAMLTLIRTDGLRSGGQSDLRWRWTPTAEEQLLAAETLPIPTQAPTLEARVQPVQTRSGVPETAGPESGATTASGTPSPAAAPPEPEVTSAPATAPGAVSADVPALAIEPAARVAAVDAAREAEWSGFRGPAREAEWPGFRGPARDAVVRGTRISRDWSRAAPTEIWRRPIGPGWSSFAVQGNRVYTQEQRGEYELVSAYRLDSGEPVWQHRDATRFWESNGGAGPRATPTLSRGRVFTLGANGTVNALDAGSGSVFWSRSATGDTGRRVPDWGIASSPLVVDDLVIVATAGSLVAYDAASGQTRWFGPRGGSGYSSPHLFQVGDTTQVLLVNGPGAIGVSPADGTVLWSHAWPGDSITQPAVLPDGGLLIGSGSGMATNGGTRRLSVVRDGEGWAVRERWTSRGLKPYFNDFVVHNRHVFGFDGSILACIDLETGERAWKGGRYGNGQLILLPEQDLLLVLSEDGELALVEAKADRFTEVARSRALEGKTWNHPVLVGDVLLVRNGEEMAAFRLAAEDR